MSEIEKEMDEEEVVDHWSHHHPLNLVQTNRRGDCYGCGWSFRRGEHVYGCSKKCKYEDLLHEECAEMARKIRHPMHPQHILIQEYYHFSSTFKCAICDQSGIRRSIGYKCGIWGCEFEIHMRCALDRDVVDADDDPVISSHPSHPQHPLVRVSRMPCSLRCEACGTTRKGVFYACFVCRYWIHRRCATLPETIQSKDHPHSLTLSFSTLLEYIKSPCRCHVCQEYQIGPKYWIYHCEPCRYVVHVKCARVNPIPLTLPINDVVGEQIKPFVKRGQKEQDQILVNTKYMFHHHKHHLSLISSSSEKNSDYDDEECGENSELICDGCITPIIYEKKHTSSSSSSYMSCSECKYFLHMECFQLPLELPSLPLHHKVDHSLILKSCAKLDFWKRCKVCDLYMNGLYYACRDIRCNFIADIKCASLLEPVYHLAHPHHLLNHLNVEDMEVLDPLWIDNDRYYLNYLCDAGCGNTAAKSNCYVSSSRDFVVHVRCAALPASVTDRRWDEHRLMLTYATNKKDRRMLTYATNKKDRRMLTYAAYKNRPDVSYCDKCEREMNPPSWMYHCRHCDSSFHPDCFPTISGKYRNIKFGQQYVVPANAHPHPLTYHFLTLKRRCDVCGLDKVGERGFQCASCYFFICMDDCGKKMLEQGHIQTVD